MKDCACGVLLFAVGLAVGMADSDDSLLHEAVQRESTAYDRGYAEALSKFQTFAVQVGFARWDRDPQTGRPRQFAWILPTGEDGGFLNELPAAAELTAARYQQPCHRNE